MPKIPTNMSAIPSEVPDLDESIPYHVVCRAAKWAVDDNGQIKTDVNGHYFISGMELEVLEPEQFRGRRIFENYLPVSNGKAEDATDSNIVRTKRAMLVFKVQEDPDGLDAVEFVGKEGDVTAVNEMYQGRKNPKVAEFLL
jgi:hypothetical protein